MRKHFIRNTFVVSSVAAALIGVGSSGALASDPSVASKASPEAVTEAALDSYLSVSDEQWTTTPGGQPSLQQTRQGVTESMSVNAQVRDALAKAGTPVVSATSTTNVIDVEPGRQGTVVVHADVTTVFAYGGAGATWPKGSNWSDEHELVLDVTGETPVVVADRVVDPPADETPGMPNGAPPIPSSADRSTATGGSGMATMSEPTVDVYELQGYALQWTLPPNDGDDVSDFNPDFAVFDNNCANFASQSLHAGGWEYRGGINPYDTANWTPNLTGPAGPSYTWSAARYQYTFVSQNGYEWLPNIWDATPGALLYTDWDPNNTPDGTIDHVMVVVFAAMGDPSGPLISQKTPNRGAIPLTQSIAYATAEGKTIVWYGLKP